MSWPPSFSVSLMTTSSTPTPGADHVAHAGSDVTDDDRVLVDALHRVWGFSGFRPLQREAMHAILASRDSVVVLPTGGGKSLCFQAPALAPSPRLGGGAPGSGDGPPGRQGVALVVSPLISL